jgi:hypothetical protein
MKVFDLFSRRQATLRGEVPDVFTYDRMPQELRVQVLHILEDGLGNYDQFLNSRKMVGGAYEFVVTTLCREYGKMRLRGKEFESRNFYNELRTFILDEPNVERVLDAVELSFRVIAIHGTKWEYMHSQDAESEAKAAIDELNVRFKQHAVGYRFEGTEILRVDSELLHAEVVKPALQLLRNPIFKGAEAEFLGAHTHYRQGNHKECLADCLKSIESCIKAIALKHGWQHAPNATAKPLIDLLFEKSLVPAFWAQHFSGLRAMLESGVPTARNRLGGHGQGAEITLVPEYMASYVLHQTAAFIVFLASAEAVYAP